MLIAYHLLLKAETLRKVAPNRSPGYMEILGYISKYLELQFTKTPWTTCRLDLTFHGWDTLNCWTYRFNIFHQHYFLLKFFAIVFWGDLVLAAPNILRGVNIYTKQTKLWAVLSACGASIHSIGMSNNNTNKKTWHFTLQRIFSPVFTFQKKTLLKLSHGVNPLNRFTATPAIFGFIQGDHRPTTHSTQKSEGKL